MTDHKKAADETCKQAAKDTAERVSANSSLPTATATEMAAAQKEGIKEAVKEAAKDTYQYLTDGNLPGDPPARKFTGSDEIMQYAGLVDLGIDQFTDAVSKGGSVPEEKVAGLLALERAGKNRTAYVKVMCTRLGVKSPYEVTSAGPDHTNDVTPVTKL